MLYLLFAILVLQASNYEVDAVTTQSPPDCHVQANHTCLAANRNMTWCANDGKVYHDLCSVVHAMCENHHLSASTHPDPLLCPSQIHTTTPPPTLSPFEIAFYDEIAREIDIRLQVSHGRGITPTKAKPIFSVQDHAHAHYVRNPDCWTADLDLTCMSPWNSDLQNRKAGTLISPRHAVWARHYSIQNNSTIRFVTMDNQVVDRKVVSSKIVDQQHGGPFYGRDIVVGLLDSDVPSTISFAKVLPHHLLTMHPPNNVHLPVLSTDQEEKALVTDFFMYSNTSISLTAPMNGTLHYDYYEPKIDGDSGNPSFFVIDHELVLLFTFTTGGAGGGTNIIGWYDDINHIMTQLGGGYQLTEIDLSRFLGSGVALPALIG